MIKSRVLRILGMTSLIASGWLLRMVIPLPSAQAQSVPTTNVSLGLPPRHYLVFVENGKFRVLAPAGVKIDDLTRIGVAAAEDPRSITNRIDLTTYNGKYAVLSGTLNGSTLYSTQVVESNDASLQLTAAVYLQNQRIIQLLSKKK